MSKLVGFLIIFFSLLIVYQIILTTFNSNIEGLENTTYQEYDTTNDDNIRILTQQNSGNIEVLKQKIDDMMGLNKKFQDLSGNVALIQTQVDGLIQAQQEYASSYPSAPPVTGIETDVSVGSDINEADVAPTT